MSTVALHLESVELDELGPLTAISRRGGQGRVYAPARVPTLKGVHPGRIGSRPVVKLYHGPPPPGAGGALEAMVQWSRRLAPSQRELLYRVSAWPLATITCAGALAGIAMQDVRGRFEVPFHMPSGRTAEVLLQLEHLLEPDAYLALRGQPVTVDTRMRARVAERISAAFAYLHRHAIVVSDVSPSNLLISFADAEPEVCLIDCDSMVFRGRRALTSVETGDWQMPPGFAEPPYTRAADAYKLGLLVLRLFARSHDARRLEPHRHHVPAELQGLLARALSADAPNRPPAGELQLALRRTIADGALARRYPGPERQPAGAPAARAIGDDARPPARSQPARARAAQGPRRVGARNPATPRGRAAAPRGARRAATGRGGRPAAHLGPSRAFTVVWLVTGLLLLVLFAHLVQSEAVSASGAPGRSTGFGPGSGVFLRQVGPGGGTAGPGGQGFAP